MSEERRGDLVLWPGEPSGRSFTVWPFQVGIVQRDGRVEDIFTEGTRRLPRGNVRTFVASTAPFTLTFWLQDLDDMESPSEGTALDMPVLTMDDQLVTGRIDMMLRVSETNSERLLQLLQYDSATVEKDQVADMVKNELLAKVFALDLHRYTLEELQGNDALLRETFESLQRELGSTLTMYGLDLINSYVVWGLAADQRNAIKEQRHRVAIRDIEREREIQDATGAPQTPYRTPPTGAGPQQQQEETARPAWEQPEAAHPSQSAPRTSRKPHPPRRFLGGRRPREDRSTGPLRRSRTNRWLGGVCAGLGKRYGFDPTALRLILLVMGLATFFIAILLEVSAIVWPLLMLGAYLLACRNIPEEPDDTDSDS